eukprot:TRINITY_DN4821_c0_g1_i1.p1 TRINITY_DN4821_c0_g1~~TRINITY_DN4821_c0_g1_i1.p1  ORF type:complete len:673 (-),score=199.52 TRINITY_DN4821_c0_g1_i1:196-2214(-)
MSNLNIIPNIVRDVYKKGKDIALNTPEIERKVRNATSNDKWGPTGTQMQEISRATYNYQDFAVIMQVLWKRINDPGKYWRHVYKSLLLLDYLIRNGSEQVIRECRNHIIEIQTLNEFTHIDPETQKDTGLSVRERAKQIIELIHDDRRIKQEREKAAANRDKYVGIGSEGDGGGYGPGGYGDRGYGERGYGDRDRDRGYGGGGGYGDRPGYGEERDRGGYGGGSGGYGENRERSSYGGNNWGDQDRGEDRERYTGYSNGYEEREERYGGGRDRDSGSYEERQESDRYEEETSRNRPRAATGNSTTTPPRVSSAPAITPPQPTQPAPSLLDIGDFHTPAPAPQNNVGGLSDVFSNSGSNNNSNFGNNTSSFGNGGFSFNSQPPSNNGFQQNPFAAPTPSANNGNNGFGSFSGAPQPANNNSNFFDQTPSSGANFFPNSNNNPPSSAFGAQPSGGEFNPFVSANNNGGGDFFSQQAQQPAPTPAPEPTGTDPWAKASNLVDLNNLTGSKSAPTLSASNPSPNKAPIVNAKAPMNASKGMTSGPIVKPAAGSTIGSMGSGMMPPMGMMGGQPGMMGGQPGMMGGQPGMMGNPGMMGGQPGMMGGQPGMMGQPGMYPNPGMGSTGMMQQPGYGQQGMMGGQPVMMGGQPNPGMMYPGSTGMMQPNPAMLGSQPRRF